MKERFNSLSIFWKKFNSLRHLEKNKGFNSLSHIQRKRVQFFELFKKTHNSLSQLEEKYGSILWVILEHKKSWTLGVILQKDFNSLSHLEKVQKKRFNSMSHFKKIILKEFHSLSFFLTHGSNVQFFESYFKKFNSLSIFCLKKQFLESFISEK